MKPTNKCSRLTCIIDDDKLFVNLAKKLITVKKFSEDILVFKNGKEALHFFKTEERIPDVILLDLNMPVMNGWEFLSEFSLLKKEYPKKIELYIISSSADPFDYDKAQTIECVHDFISKPITINAFEQIFNVA